MAIIPLSGCEVTRGLQAARIQTDTVEPVEDRVDLPAVRIDRCYTRPVILDRRRGRSTSHRKRKHAERCGKKKGIISRAISMHTTAHNAKAEVPVERYLNVTILLVMSCEKVDKKN